MGDFLSVANKEKHSEDVDFSSVSIFIIFSLDTLLVVCKDGEKEWKIHISPILN